MKRLLLLLVACSTPPAPVVLDSAAEPERVFGHIAVRRAPKLADVAGGLPLVAGWSGRPIAGKPFRISWTTRPTAPFPDVPGAVLIDTRLSIPADVPGWKGGMLQVAPRWVLYPKDGTPLTKAAPGVYEIRITLPKAWVGRTFALQFLTAERRLSPAVVLTIGNR